MNISYFKISLGNYVSSNRTLTVDPGRPGSPGAPFRPGAPGSPTPPGVPMFPASPGLPLLPGIEKFMEPDIW